MRDLLTPTLRVDKKTMQRLSYFLEAYMPIILTIVLSTISIISFLYYLNNGLGLAYNDARSHLDIGRRVVEGLKPGLAQLGSVWLPLPHLLMVPTIWSDFMWHTGLSGALQSMVSFVVTGLIIYFFLKNIGVSMLGRLFGIFVFVANINILYLQSTAMTELLLIATMTSSVYFLVMWHKAGKLTDLIVGSFLVMLSTLIRYDGWFLLFITTVLVGIHTLKARSLKLTEGTIILFLTLASFGIALWLLWNLLIFKDPFFFAFGPYSAQAQQEQLSQAGILSTKHNLLLSTTVYLYALVYNSYGLSVLLGGIGLIVFLFDKKLSPYVRLGSLSLLAPFLFNVIALYLGHSVLFIQGYLGGTWFNVRYGIMLLPAIAIFLGYLVHRAGLLRYPIVALTIFMLFFAFRSVDAVTIDDARVGSSQKNVSEVSGWLNQNAKDKEGFILISAASHDAIIFSSGLPMKRFIHEGTGKYWDSATSSPDRWARWIIMRTNDLNDQTFKLVKQSGALDKYALVDHYPFADIYQIKPEYMDTLQTKPVISNNK